MEPLKNPKEASEGIPKGTSGIISEEILERIFNGTPTGIPVEIAGKISRGTLEEPPSGIPGSSLEGKEIWMKLLKAFPMEHLEKIWNL